MSPRPLLTNHCHAPSAAATLRAPSPAPKLRVASPEPYRLLLRLSDAPIQTTRGPCQLSVQSRFSSPHQVVRFCCPPLSSAVAPGLSPVIRHIVARCP